VPFRILSRKNITKDNALFKNWHFLGVKIISSHVHKFSTTPRPFYKGVSAGSVHEEVKCIQTTKEGKSKTAEIEIGKINSQTNT